MSYTRYNAFVIDSNIETRARLKQAAHNVTNFQKVLVYSTCRDVLAAMHSNEKCDVVFISYSFSEDEICNFIEQAKKTKIGQDCAYILVLRSNEEEGSTLANNVLVGAHGFLFEPFSVEALREIAEIAAKVKHENSLNRQKAAMGLILSDAMKTIDKIAMAKDFGRDTTRVMAKLQERCAKLKAFQGDSLESYYDVASDMFQNAPPPPKVNYAGVSKRVKARMEAKLEQELLEEEERED